MFITAKVMRVYKARQMVAELNSTATSASTAVEQAPSTAEEQAAVVQYLPTDADMMKEMTNDEEMEMLESMMPISSYDGLVCLDKFLEYHEATFVSISFIILSM